MMERLLCQAPGEVAAHQLDLFLAFFIRRPGGADGDGGHGGAEISRFLRFPGFETKIEPLPGPFVFAVGRLSGPQVYERFPGCRGRRGATLRTVVQGENERVENSLCALRLPLLW